MKKRVYGVLGVDVQNSMFNAGFDGVPTAGGDGRYLANNFAFKYTTKKFMDMKGMKLLGFKEYKLAGNKLLPMCIDEKYAYITGIEIKEDTEDEKILKGLLGCMDVRQYGCAFTVKKHNYQIIGPVQITDGINIDDESEIIESAVLSQYQNSERKDAANTSIGTKYTIDHALFCFHFSVFPGKYIKCKALNGDTYEYSEEDYKIFKEASLNGVTNLNSVSKVGSTNCFGIFIECKEGSMPQMGNLHQMLTYRRMYSDKGYMKEGVLDITRLIEYIKGFEDNIEKIEIYTKPEIVSMVYNGGKEDTILTDKNVREIAGFNMPANICDIKNSKPIR